MKLVEYPDADMMALDLAQIIAGELEDVLVGGGRATFVVPGGDTPGPVFDSLSAAIIDWKRVDVMLSDERWVPDVNLRSNARLVKERLLTGRAATAQFHPLYARADDPEEVLAEIEAGIVPCLPINVLVLGMGEDMHTASLLPGGDRLEDALDDDAPILLPMVAPGVPERRVTFSARVLNGALSKHLVITGTPKRNALEKARNMDPVEAPVAAILDDCTVHWAP